MYDLHTHTRCSDGTTSGRDNAAMAAAAGLRGLAVTDHDTLAGWAEAELACAAFGIEFVPGVELSARDGVVSVHVLGYWVDADHPGIIAECARLRGEREERMHGMLARLARLGMDVAEEEVRVHAGDAPVGRPHVAAALVARGLVPDVDAAFDRWLADGRPAHVPQRALDADAAVALVRDAGGVAVLAHPGRSGGGPTGLPERLVAELSAQGLAGVEVDHPSHDTVLRAHWRALASRYDLVPTGASDFHGTRKEARIGVCTTPTVVLEDLRARRLLTSAPESDA